MSDFRENFTPQTPYGSATMSAGSDMDGTEICDFFGKSIDTAPRACYNMDNHGGMSVPIILNGVLIQHEPISATHHR